MQLKAVLILASSKIMLSYDHNYRSYQNPPRPSTERLEQASISFYGAVLSHLKGTSHTPFTIPMELDIWRYITSGKGKDTQHRGYRLYEKDDFRRFSSLPVTGGIFLTVMERELLSTFPSK